MKLGAKGPVFLIIGGLCILLTGFDDTFVPWYLKLIAGLGILTYGAVRLIRSRIQEGYTVFSWTIIPSALFFIALIVGGYYYLASPEEKDYKKWSGTFNVPFSGVKYPGTASLEGDIMTLQFRVPGTAIQVKDITIQIQDSTIQKSSIEWTCALTRDFQVARCTTGLDALTEFKELFYDHDFFTVRFDFNDPLEIDRIDNISFVMHTNRGDKKIVIREVKNSSH